MRVHKTFLRIVAIALSLSLVNLAVAAGMDDVMNKMFNTMSNVTPGGVYETQSRGIIAGPSLYIRTKPQTVQPFNIQPPRIRAGCNGIDIYAGSFSFINKDALVNLMRNIAASAVPFAFQMALDAICKPCAHYMKEMQNIADQMNKFNINSCKVAKAGVEWAAGAIKHASEAAAAGISSEEGATVDSNEAANHPTRDASSLLAAFSEDKANKLKFNISYDASSGSEVGKWFVPAMNGAAQTDFAEILQSLTGTVISRYIVGVDKDGNAGERTLDVKPIPPTINFHTFMNGGSVEVYRCEAPAAEDPVNSCLTLRTPLPQVALVGMRERVRQMLFGVTPGDGLVDHISSRTTYFTAAEKAFIASIPGGLMSNMVALSVNKQALATYADAMVNFIALDLTEHFVSELFRSVGMAAIKKDSNPALKTFLDDLTKLRAEMINDRAVVASQLENFERSMKIAQLIRANLNRFAVNATLSGQ